MSSPTTVRSSRRPELALIGALIVTYFLVRALTAPWFIVGPSSGPATLYDNGAAITAPTSFTALQAANSLVVLTTPNQGTLSPLEVATPKGNPGSTGGLPLTLVFAIGSLLLTAAAAVKRSLVAVVLSFFGAIGAIDQVGALTQWIHRPVFLLSQVAYGPGVADYQLVLWGVLGLSVVLGAVVGVQRVTELGKRYNLAVHTNDHEALGHSALDRLSRVIAGAAVDHGAGPA